MLQEEMYKLLKINNLYDCNLYEKTNNITISSTGESFNIGSIYSQFDCKHKPQLSVATIVCLTFFIPLIFYLLCWIIIVKVMKRGDLCIKAFCLDNNKKDDGLASQEVTNQTIINRI